MLLHDFLTHQTRQPLDRSNFHIGRTLEEFRRHHSIIHRPTNLVRVICSAVDFHLDMYSEAVADHLLFIRDSVIAIELQVIESNDKHEAKITD